MSDNRWIISTHKYAEHRSLAAAEAEIKRLREANPRKRFHMYRIKRTVESEDESNA